MARKAKKITRKIPRRAARETTRGGLLRRGLGYRESNVSACLNVSADHLGLRGIDTVEQLAEVRLGAIRTGGGVVAQTGEQPQVYELAIERGEFIPLNLMGFRNHFLAPDAEPEEAPMSEGDPALGVDPGFGVDPELAPLPGEEPLAAP